ncbi:MAG: histidine phosphatase family protein [Gammaproteobacteria bacterium]|nr:histidine phosphatase family protein [Gammaproteobacteria bacterium]
MRLLILVLLATLPWPIVAAEIETGPVLVITRHAEKQQGDDPCLTREGQQRAARLAALLENMPVKSLLSTDYCRTRETLDPLARQAGLDIQTYSPMDGEALRSRLFDGRNGAVVVSAHSNTLPELLAQLGAEVPKISESEYGNLYVVTFNKEGKVGGLARLTY